GPGGAAPETAALRAGRRLVPGRRLPGAELRGRQIMNADLALDLCRRALELAVLVMAPLLLAALTAGVVAGLFQAATQIQEPTLAFVPKLVALGLSLLVFGPWITDRLRVFMSETIQLIGGLS